MFVVKSEAQLLTLPSLSFSRWIPFPLYAILIAVARRCDTHSARRFARSAQNMMSCRDASNRPALRAFLRLFAKAHAILSKDAWLVENEPERLKRLLRLSRQ